MEIGEYFMIQRLVWSTNLFPNKKIPDFCRTKLIWVGAGSGLGLGLVSKVVPWVLFEISLLITLEPHVGHTHQIPRFLYFILDNNPFVR